MKEKEFFNEYIKAFLNQNAKLNLISKMMKNFYGKNTYLTVFQLKNSLKSTTLLIQKHY